jgi:hypothetical protein
MAIVDRICGITFDSTVKNIQKIQERRHSHFLKEKTPAELCAET